MLQNVPWSSTKTQLRIHSIAIETTRHCRRSYPQTGGRGGGVRNLWQIWQLCESGGVQGVEKLSNLTWHTLWTVPKSSDGIFYNAGWKAVKDVFKGHRDILKHKIPTAGSFTNWCWPNFWWVKIAGGVGRSFVRNTHRGPLRMMSTNRRRVNTTTLITLTTKTAANWYNGRSAAIVTQHRTIARSKF